MLLVTLSLGPVNRDRPQRGLTDPVFRAAMAKSPLVSVPNDLPTELQRVATTNKKQSTFLIVVATRKIAVALLATEVGPWPPRVRQLEP